MRILILNGPNLNFLGRREPNIYGTTTIDDCLTTLRQSFPDIEFEYYQSNAEGSLIDRLQQAENDGIDGAAFNAGAYTHTSIALLDCIRSLSFPVIEVHLSNVHAREPFRHHSMIASACLGVICGFGITSYTLAVQALIKR